MTATIKTAFFPFAQAQTEFDSNPMHFLNEDLASVPVSGIPEEFRKLSRYLPVIVLVPKSALDDKTTQKSRDPISPSRASSRPVMSAYRWMRRRSG